MDSENPTDHVDSVSEVGLQASSSAVTPTRKETREAPKLFKPYEKYFKFVKFDYQDGGLNSHGNVSNKRYYSKVLFTYHVLIYFGGGGGGSQ